jgi:hypothetical protein
VSDASTSGSRIEFRIAFEGVPLSDQAASQIESAIQNAVLESLGNLGIADRYEALPFTAGSAGESSVISPIHIILGLIFSSDSGD